MSMKYKFALVALFAFCVSGAHFASAQGQGEGNGRPDMFAKSDANGDGKITLDEFKAEAAEHFKMMDKNGDGVLTKDEMQRPRRGGAEGSERPEGQQQQGSMPDRPAAPEGMPQGNPTESTTK